MALRVFLRVSSISLIVSGFVIIWQHRQKIASITPFRPEIISVLSPQAWADLEMLFAVLVILASFAQKQYDHSFTHKGLLGFLGYVSLVLKTTYAFSVLWDGVFLYGHTLTEQPRPIATGAMFIIASQQAVHLSYKYATSRLVKGDTWPLALLDTTEWAREVIAKRRKP